MTGSLDSPWRRKAREICDRVRRESPEARGKDLRRLLRQAYPFGQRKFHPYRIWCSEVRRALGISAVKEDPRQSRLRFLSPEDRDALRAELSGLAELVA